MVDATVERLQLHLESSSQMAMAAELKAKRRRLETEFEETKKLLESKWAAQGQKELAYLLGCYCRFARSDLSPPPLHLLCLQ